MSESVKSVDQEIIDLYNEGDIEQALKLFVNEYQTRLYSLAYQMLGKHDDAIDTLQEILIQVTRNPLLWSGNEETINKQDEGNWMRR